MPTRLQIAKKDIFRAFEDSSHLVFTKAQIKKILSENRRFWRLAGSTTFANFLEFLKTKGKLREHEFPFPSRKEVRYSWGDVPLYALLMSLKPKCYFCHYTAIHFYGLTEQEPKNIYINHEQKAGPGKGQLEQGRIDSAFKRQPRITNNLIEYEGLKIYLINGMNTNLLGVDEQEVVESSLKYMIRITDLERTLIDAAVRPFYSGGVWEVIKAFRNAAKDVSTNRLGALLKKLQYVYPYHQAIGFYLDQSGTYSDKAVSAFRDKFDYKFDFYLDYNMKNPKYNERWRLFVPDGL